jgi:hypothetical protein
MTSAKHIGMDVHKESISIALLNSVGKVVFPGTLQSCRFVASGGRKCRRSLAGPTRKALSPGK